MITWLVFHIAKMSLKPKQWGHESLSRWLQWWGVTPVVLAPASKLQAFTARTRGLWSAKSMRSEDPAAHPSSGVWSGRDQGARAERAAVGSSALLSELNSAAWKQSVQRSTWNKSKADEASAFQRALGKVSGAKRGREIDLGEGETGKGGEPRGSGECCVVTTVEKVRGTEGIHLDGLSLRWWGSWESSREGVGSHQAHPEL